jgi:protein-tyrosine phosphatase
MSLKKVLFICSGNYYRSRFAEHVFNRWAERERIPWRADSRGLRAGECPTNVGPISPHAIEGLSRRGWGVRRTSATPSIDGSDFESSDRVNALDDLEHQPMMEAPLPQGKDRSILACSRSGQGRRKPRGENRGIGA